jgi:dTDP-glucose 4,6-dehydratase
MAISNISNMVLVTGGAGFIGSNFVLNAINKWNLKIINLDLLTYAGNINNLSSIINNPNHLFIKGDIANIQLLETLFQQYQPKAVINFAAESHVDRSINDPSQFIHTNIFGTYCLLEAAKSFWIKLAPHDKNSFKFLHISTDEVYGSLASSAPSFTENSSYLPNSPYAASKASSDHLVRAWHHTYGMPTIITNCSNNYGPFQFPEKLIPLIITNAFENKLLPIYGDGKNIRDWLFVDDHCEAIHKILCHGKAGSTYNIGGNNEKTNLEIVSTICLLLDRLYPLSHKSCLHPKTGKKISSYSELIEFVNDRLGHDKRYAINASKIQQELAWYSKETFETGIEKTVKWYIENRAWVKSITNNKTKN